MKNIKYIFALMLLLVSVLANSQDIEYVKTIVTTLTAPEMFGRGYVNAGDKKAAYYIENEFKKMNLIAFDTQLFQSGDASHKRKLPKYTQDFSMKVNTFPQTVLMNFDSKTILKAGEDYILKPSSGSIAEKDLELVYLSKKNIKNEKAYDQFVSEDYSGQAVVIDQIEFAKETENEFLPEIMNNSMQAEAVIILTESPLSWGRVSDKEEKYPTFYLKKDKLPEDAIIVHVAVDNKFIRNYESQNVVGLKIGKKYPDKYIVIGAHYDHMGCLGKDVYYPGANDNASGVAMMLDLAKYYTDVFNEPDYSMIFIGFGGEEAGLLGSKYFVDHPLIPLENIEFMINLDMMSTGETGMMCVNASSNKTQWQQLKTINEQKHFVTELLSRGPAAISDHHFFHEKGVPAFFFYLMGEKEKDYFYHQPKDVISNISFYGYNGAFLLITEFIDQL